MNVDPKDPAGRLEIHHPGVEDLDNRIGTLPVVGELTVLTEEILHVKKNQLPNLVGVRNRRAVMVVLVRAGRLKTFLSGELATQL